MEWKHIVINSEETEYKVSEEGKVMNKQGTKLMSQHANQCGYLIVRLYVKGKYMCISAHILVAKAFIPNPENLEQVNHKDSNRTNNNVNNLEWMSRSENILHSYKNPKRGRCGTPITKYDLEGNFICDYRSVADACKELKTETSSRALSNGIITCALGKTESYKNYAWKYSKEQSEELPDNGLPIPGYDGYIAFPCGKIRSKRFNRFIKTSKDGYESVILCVQGKRMTRSVHKLIALTFIPNPDQKTVVNHKNGEKLDNRVENLEWVTLAENSIHSVESGFSKTRNVIQYSLDDKYIASYPSLREAQRCMGKSPDSTAIFYACQGRSKTAYGYKWKYKL